MDLFIARQPVFDRNKSISGYELLHRESDMRNEYTQANGEYATSRVITGAFLSIGLESLTNGKKAFINFTPELLMSGVAYLLPKEQLILELLETVPPTREVLDICAALKSEGYVLALDDYVLNAEYEPLAAIADIIKVDFRRTSQSDQRRAIRMRRGGTTSFLAEKVETEAEFQRACDLGYSLFQGYFFARPVIMSTNTIPTGNLGYIKLMQAVNDPNPDFQAITSAIESDVTLSVETIRLANSAYYSCRNKISSIKQAVVTLGLEGIRKWTYLLALRRLSVGKPDVLVSTSIVRSKFMELLAGKFKKPFLSPEFSMVGLFSLLDVLTGCPFVRLLADLNIADEVKEILIGSGFQSPLGQAYRLMLEYERGNWNGAAAISDAAGIRLDAVAQSYITALRWYQDLTSINMIQFE